jgi:hypothetical protein
MCAVHNGSIKSFETVNERIADPLEFSRIFLRKGGINFTQLSKKGAMVAGSIMAVLLTSGSGAVLIPAAAGAAVGTRMGSQLFDRYFGEIQEFEFQRIRDGSDPSIILIDGFLNERTQTQESWLSGLGVYGQGKAVYRLRWESQTLQKFASMAQALVVGPGIETSGAKNVPGGATDGDSATDWMLSAASKFVSPLKLVGVTNLVTNPWTMARVRSEQAGQLLADMLRRCSGRSFDLVGHSRHA